MRFLTKNEKGFTLVEVLASLVILSIVLMSFMAVFANTNRLAVTNSEKLVVINLADAYLEKMKIDPSGTIGPDKFPPTIEYDFNGNPESYIKTFSSSTTMNLRVYEISIKLTQNEEENRLSLFNTIVTVKLKNSKLSSSVEGYIPYEKNTK